MTKKFRYVTVCPSLIYSKDLSESMSGMGGSPTFLFGTTLDLDHYATLLAVNCAQDDNQSFLCFDGEKWAKEMKK